MARRDDAGNGPTCPVSPEHGRTIRSTTRTPGREFWCPHQDHGGNGKFFSDEEAHGKYELKESDLSTIYDSAVRDIESGALTMEQAVKDIAARTGRSPAQVRESINTMLGVVRADKERREEMATAAKTKTTKAAAPPKAQRVTLEKVDGAKFAAIRDELGLNNKQAAEATGAAGMGKSSTYVYILTTTGASVRLFEQFEQALRKYARDHKAEIAAAKKAAAAAPAAKPAKAAKAAPAAKAPAAKAAPAKAAAAPKANGKAPIKPVADAPARTRKAIVPASAEA